MNRWLRTVLVVAACLGVFVGVVGVSDAAPPTQAGVDNGADVILGAPPSSGNVSFRYGWKSLAQFASPPVGYWLGSYEKTNSHDGWSSESPLPPLGGNAPADSIMQSVDFSYSDTVTPLPPGDYCVNFFARSSCAPATNAAVISLVLTVRSGCAARPLALRSAELPWAPRSFWCPACERSPGSQRGRVVVATRVKPLLAGRRGSGGHSAAPEA